MRRYRLHPKSVERLFRTRRLEMKSFDQIHIEACERRERFYIDPTTGYQVFTEIAHKERGRCCGSGCRHCPFDFENVKDTHFIMRPSWLNQRVECADGSSSSSSGMSRNVKLLFWSGGKDSFLALRSLLRGRESLGGICLLTTFDARLKIVANQELDIELLRKQASHLNINLVGVPLIRNGEMSYSSRIKSAVDFVENSLGGEHIMRSRKCS